MTFLKKSLCIIETQSKEALDNSLAKQDTKKLTKIGFFSNKTLFFINKQNFLSSLVLIKFNNISDLLKYLKKYIKKKNFFVYLIKLKYFFFKSRNLFSRFFLIDFIITQKLKYLLAGVIRSNFLLKQYSPLDKLM